MKAPDSGVHFNQLAYAVFVALACHISIFSCVHTVNTDVSKLHCISNQALMLSLFTTYAWF